MKKYNSALIIASILTFVTTPSSARSLNRNHIAAAAGIFGTVGVANYIVQRFLYEKNFVNGKS